jgi:hypothetical protein
MHHTGQHTDARQILQHIYLARPNRRNQGIGGTQIDPGSPFPLMGVKRLSGFCNLN